MNQSNDCNLFQSSDVPDVYEQVGTLFTVNDQKDGDVIRNSLVSNTSANSSSYYSFAGATGANSKSTTGNFI